MNQEEQIKELQKPLDPKNVRPAPKGKFGEYVDAYHVISEANRIFGEFGWSYAVTRLDLVSEQTVELNGNNGPYQQYRVGYMATVRVDVGGSFREGAAVGVGLGNPNSIADHHESAVKDAETDALKRALRSFGNTLGLALYDKTQANVQAPRDPEAVASSLIDLVKRQAELSALENVKSNQKFADALAWLRADHEKQFATVDAAIAAKEQEFGAMAKDAA